jgi:uncharacterized protein YndB with AHSA1/START domain
VKQGGHDLTMERTFAAPADRVFDAFTSEEVMKRWWQAGTGWDTPEARVDLRVGGEIRVVMHDPAKDALYGGGGRYTEIDPPSRLSFTWIWDDDTDQVEQLIEIEFSERDGQTHMRFTHRNLWDEETLADHEDGWNKVFDNLSRELESR